MSAGWVIDPSVGFAWIHPDQATAKTDELLRNLGTAAEVVVPGLWFFEMANGLLVLQRRKKTTASERRTALASLSSLHIRVDNDGSAFGDITEIAEEHGLTIYDASYLKLAMRRKLGLASRDEALLKAANRSGVAVL